MDKGSLKPLFEQKPPGADVKANEVWRVPEEANFFANNAEAKDMNMSDCILAVFPKSRRDSKKDNPSFENFGNFNFGATGRAADVSRKTLLRGAGLVQDGMDLLGLSYSNPEGGNFWDSPVSSYGDDPRDQKMIMKGICGFNEVAIDTGVSFSLTDYAGEGFCVLSFLARGYNFCMERCDKKEIREYIFELRQENKRLE